MMRGRRLSTSKKKPTASDTCSSSRSEHVEQREFVSWFRKTFPDEIIFAIPNGGARNIVVAAKLKLEGVTPGVWDLFVPDRRLWIEFKRADKGTLSPSQVAFGNHMLRIGHQCMAAWGCEDAISQLQNGIRVNWTRPK